MKNNKLVTIIVLLCCGTQVNATMMQYNTRNQMVKVDKQIMTYSPKGYLSSVDSVNIIHQATGIIEIQGSATATIFGGIRSLSNGAFQTIFTDHYSTLKTTSNVKDDQRSYTDPYGDAVHEPVKEIFSLQRNRITFDGGYQINNDLINFNARSYIPFLKVFTSMDSYNVANRYNFSNGNPIMKFDPSGHSAKSILNLIGNLTIGFNIGSLLLGDKKETSNVITYIVVMSLSSLVMGGLVIGGIVWISRANALPVEALEMVEGRVNVNSIDRINNNPTMNQRTFNFHRNILTDRSDGYIFTDAQHSIKALDDIKKWNDNQLISNRMRADFLNSHVLQRSEDYGTTIDSEKNILEVFMSTIHELGENETFVSFREKYFKKIDDMNLKFEMKVPRKVKNYSATDLMSFEDFENGQNIYGHYVKHNTNDLFHGFEEKGLKEWIKTNNSCPICKVRFNRKNLRKVIFDINNVSS